MTADLRALLFDFDGLILDTETPEMTEWAKVFRQHGVEFPMDYWAWTLGRGADEMVESPLDVLERLCGRSLDRESVEEGYRQRRMELIYAQPPLPGVVDLLREAEAEGVRRAVVSSSKHAWVDGHLERLGLRHFFEMTVCADDVERAKPYPDLYLMALERMELMPSEAIALEDSPNGTRAAIGAGLFCVVVPNHVTRMLDVSHASARLESLEGIGLAGLRALRDKR